MEDCAICLEWLDNDINIKWSCRYKFHSNCIKNWNKFCPLCKTTKLDICWYWIVDEWLIFKPKFNKKEKYILQCNRLRGDGSDIFIEMFNKLKKIFNYNNQKIFI